MAVSAGRVAPFALSLVSLVSLMSLRAADARAQLDQGRFFTVTVEPAKVAVGDSVTLHFRLIINERDLLSDTLPQPAEALPPGVRLLSVENLRRGADEPFTGTGARVLTGTAVLAFYRPGIREVPRFGVPWVQIVTGHRGLITSDAATVEVTSVLPGGNPSLRDIREPDLPPSLTPLWTLLGAAAVGAVAWAAARRKRRPVPVPVPPAPPPPPAPADPFTLAVARLDRIDAEGWAAHGDVERHYEGVAGALREYLEAAEGIPAPERTTTELLWSLPPRLAEGGLRRRVQDVLGDADLVKFARRRPDAKQAAGYTRAARELLERWHGAARTAEELDAVR